MSEWRRRVLRNRNVVCMCLAMAALPAAMVRVLFLYGSPPFPDGRKETAGMFAAAAAASPVEDGGTCDLSQGNWVPDPSPPLYTNQTCWQIQDTQNCMRNGRPDSQYLYWKWKPRGCEPLRPDAAAFLRSMRGKRLAFVGDSIARNQMQSLLCILTQVEKPINTLHTEDDKTNHWLFPSYAFTLTIYWSPYLVRQSSARVPGTNTSMTQLDLDALDPWAAAMPGTDVVVLSSGQWFFKAGMYKEGGRPVGCHHCPPSAPQGAGYREIGFFAPYGRAVGTALGSLLATPGFDGAAVFRTFAPDHFEGGLWDTGGTCPRTVPGGVPVTEMNRLMHEVEVTEFGRVRAAAPAWDAPRLRLLDISELAQLRPDGHPGPYRNFHPYARDSKDEFQVDCLHWCLPGPIDTWNELLMETLQRMRPTRKETKSGTLPPE